MSDEPHIAYEWPLFEDSLEPTGYLPLDKRAHACLYYLKLAMRSKLAVGRGPESQIITYTAGQAAPLWMDLEYENIARSVAIIYGLESPEEFLRFRAVVWAEAVRLGARPEDIEPALDVRPGISKIPFTS